VGATAAGLLWFTDLTVPDPYYILPIINAATLLATIELGSEGNVASDQSRQMKLFFRAFSVAMVPLTAGFPAVRRDPPARLTAAQRVLTSAAPPGRPPRLRIRCSSPTGSRQACSR